MKSFNFLLLLLGTHDSPEHILTENWAFRQLVMGKYLILWKTVPRRFFFERVYFYRFLLQKSRFRYSNQRKKRKIKGFEVILEDTIIFPEGGGQPCDHGYLNEVPVKYVVRKEDKAVHYVKEMFNVGDKVKQTIDWDRRFDHMQQHSGQHLVSAIFELDFKFPTLSWWLGEEVSYIELDTPSIAYEQIKKVENIVNNLIREGEECHCNSFY
ncbi:hypothetical protein NQ317_017357 [Molorchus minor]|uniref:Alanyl-tRNA synthetase class IIc N-terminal domain-containing protein n=1 Tax=Molorchus minor TaxID=1323400 RepID=A0ABQ9J8G6_9CUCU|nr:hypothetical protein NQ317_017357 [Molorchus minor]